MLFDVLCMVCLSLMICITRHTLARLQYDPVDILGKTNNMSERLSVMNVINASGDDFQRVCSHVAGNSSSSLHNKLIHN